MEWFFLWCIWALLFFLSCLSLPTIRLCSHVILCYYDVFERDKRDGMICVLLLSGACHVYVFSSSLITITGICKGFCSMPWNLWITCLPGWNVVMIMHQWRTWTLFFFMSWVGVLNKTTQTDIRNYAPLGGSSRHHLPSLCPAFIMTQQTRQNDVANLFSSVVYFKKKCEEHFVAFLLFTKCQTFVLFV